MIDDWSVMESEQLLVGVPRGGNHSCVPNCDFYISGGFKGRQFVQL